MTAHANYLEIAHTATKRAIDYTQWSIAAERASIISNGDGDQIAQCNDDKCIMLGRGRPPVYRMRSLKEPSALKPIEHMMWSLPNPVASGGSDLFSTLWATISGMFNVIANAAIADHEATMKASLDAQMRHLGTNHSSHVIVQKVSLKAAIMFIDFTYYLVQAASSPLIKSLKELKIDPQK